MHGTGTSEAAWLTRARQVPALSWLLLAAAAVEAILIGAFVTLAQLWPYGLVASLTPVTPFILAAGALAAARHRSEGRRWLLAAIAAFVGYGLLDAGLQLFFYLLQVTAFVPDEGWNGLWTARALAVVILRVAAPALLAAGLWYATRPAGRASAGQRVAIGALAVLGLLAAAGGLLMTTAPESLALRLPLENYVTYAIGAAVAPAFAILGIVAVRAARTQGIPIVAVAAGAGIVVAASGWLDWLFSLSQFQELPPDQIVWLVTLPTALVIGGQMAIAIGLAVAGLAGFTRRPTDS